MIPAQAVAAAALEWRGVPFAHQGRSRHGIDCAGLITVIGHQLGVLDYDTTNYGRMPDARRFLHLLRENLDECADMAPGSVLSMAFGAVQMHLGIVVYSDRFVHALAGHGVIESTLTAQWDRRVRSVWRYRGVAYDG